MAQTRSLPVGRREMILERVNATGEARVADLAAELGVSVITVRRDIAALDEQGLLRQVRGGARRLTVREQPDQNPGAAPVSAGAAALQDIGVIVPSLTYYWPRILQGASSEADAHGARLHIEAASPSAEECLESLARLTGEGAVDALLLAPDLRSGSASEEVLARLGALEVPVVLMERDPRDMDPTYVGVDSVRTDHEQGALEAFAHLHELGHRRLGLLHDRTSPTVPQILVAWRRAHDLFELSVENAALGVLDTHGNAPAQQIDSFLDLCLERGVTGIHVHSDEAALLVMQQAGRRGLDVPGELSITAHDDELSTLTRPALTAVGPDKPALGARAVQMIVRRLETPAAPFERTELLPRLHVRGSTARHADGASASRN
ncbi:substrate-binding domain-containing protein [Brachybacterium paraconglomeratum]|uniref:LacI family DNA-binding transcriptional regulator n=1 Tax=Brachybacterium paraconglomeratum TaxID=173362 RepID=UPI003F7CB2D0